MVVAENPNIGDLIGITYADTYGNEVLQFGICCEINGNNYVIREPHDDGFDAYETYRSGKLAKLRKQIRR